jgi:catechol 2,3-dioxygenase-like lactoylglutathione lyase family enzyme
LGASRAGLSRRSFSEDGSLAKAGSALDVCSQLRSRASAFAKGFGGQVSMRKNFRIISADHTGITVSDLDRSLAFWRDVLGFEFSHTAHQTGELAEEITGVPDAEIKLAVLRAPGGHKIELLQYLAPSDRKLARLRPCDVGFVHVALLVDDLDAVLKNIADSGWKAAGKPQTLKTGPNAGKRVVYVRDPDGAMIELMQPPHQNSS